MRRNPNYRKALEKARRNMEKLGRNGSKAALEAHWEVCCGDVLVAEKNMKDQDREWENAALARELLDIARFLEGYDNMVDNLCQAIPRMREAIPNRHPRLTLELLELELTVIRRIEALHDRELKAGEDVEREIDYYRRNIAYADAGQFDRIVQKGYLKADPVEWSAEYEAIIDEANRKTYSLLEGYSRGMGFCLAYWSTKRDVLMEYYGIDWKSPNMMNPSVLFD